MRIFRNSWLKGSVLVAALMVLSLGIAGCNTVEGAGEDIEDTGENISDVAD